MDPGEALMEIATFQIFVYNMRYYRSVLSVLTGEEISVAVFELFEMFIKQLPQ